MATLLHRLGKTAFRRWPLFLAGWLVALLAVGTVAATLSKPMTDAFTIPGIPSEQAADLQADLFPGSVDAFDQAPVNVVVAAPEGHSLREKPYTKAVDALIGELATLPQLPAEVALANPVQAADAQVAARVKAAKQSGTPPARARANAAAIAPLAPDGRVGIITCNGDVETPMDIEAATIDALDD
ncbi:MAG: MMPL family transporter, partial [Actinobacteria bacterium]|nr:MMPL family transporter [Actinomycetota bacterium]